MGTTRDTVNDPLRSVFAHVLNQNCFKRVFFPLLVVVFRQRKYFPIFMTATNQGGEIGFSPLKRAEL